MITDDRLLQLLDEVQAAQPTRAPGALFTAVVASVARTRQRRTWPHPRLPRWRAVSVVAAGLAVLLLVVAVWQPPAFEPGVTPGPSPSPTNPPETIDLAGAASISGQFTVANRWLASASLGVPVRFWLGPPGSGPILGAVPATSLWCPSSVSPGLVMLPYSKACIWNLRFMAPEVVGCGTSNAPTAIEFADALLSHQTLDVSDGGAISLNLAMPDGVFASGVDGRLLFVAASRPFLRDADDPDSCVLRTGLAATEIRRDIPQALFLFDVGERLVVIRFAAAQDRASGIEAEGRGYLTPIDLTILRTVHDISFQ